MEAELFCRVSSLDMPLCTEMWVQDTSQQSNTAHVRSVAADLVASLNSASANLQIQGFSEHSQESTAKEHCMEMSKAPLTVCLMVGPGLELK